MTSGTSVDLSSLIHGQKPFCRLSSGSVPYPVNINNPVMLKKGSSGLADRAANSAFRQYL